MDLNFDGCSFFFPQLVFQVGQLGFCSLVGTLSLNFHGLSLILDSLLLSLLYFRFQIVLGSHDHGWVLKIILLGDPSFTLFASVTFVFQA